MRGHANGHAGRPSGAARGRGATLGMTIRISMQPSDARLREQKPLNVACGVGSHSGGRLQVASRPAARVTATMFSLQLYAAAVALSDALASRDGARQRGSGGSVRGAAPAQPLAPSPVRRTLAFTFLDYPTVLLHADGSETPEAGVLRVMRGKRCSVRVEDARELAFAARKVGVQDPAACPHPAPRPEQHACGRPCTPCCCVAGSARMHACCCMPACIMHAYKPHSHRRSRQLSCC